MDIKQQVFVDKPFMKRKHPFRPKFLPSTPSFQAIIHEKMGQVKLIFFLFLLPVIFLSKATLSQPKDQDIYNLNLTELPKLKVTSASKVLQNIKDIPATIYVITKEEIHEKRVFYP